MPRLIPSHLFKNSDISRNAFLAFVNFQNEGDNSAHLKGELWRDRSNDHKLDLNSYLISMGATLKTSVDWLILANLDVGSLMRVRVPRPIKAPKLKARWAMRMST
jgi:hypothetical protein